MVLSNEVIAETIKVLRYPRFQRLYSLEESDLLEFAQFLRSVSEIVILDPQYNARFLRDPNDLDVLQTVERGEADILCTHDKDFFDDAVLSFCGTRGIEVCTENALLARLSKP